MTTELKQKHSAFQPLSLGVGFGSSVPQGWLSLLTQPVLIIVGLTGVGKSTVISNLMEERLDLSLLPNRRILTDEIIIPQMAENEQNLSYFCRVQRFNYTRQYRQFFSGGMAHVLSQIWINPQQLQTQLIFDGLRGKDEVNYALKAFTEANFIVLDAPNKVRLQRILKRNDAFDSVNTINSNSQNQSVDLDKLTSFAALGISEASSVFNSAEEQEILGWVRQGSVTLKELEQKLKIVVLEQQNYDAVSTRLTLEKMARERTLVIDTTVYNPQQAASQILSYLKVRQPMECLSVS
ncbi:AAA domain protein [Lyngbya aestuarii BL J]|uniref:AAA domain protein n=1 Tax=Lyngbya aestuarii BL J TaxID=1348334 RepID=U7QGJ2_9CYAN|nr:AAA family ATPase [Lyngbya aestuarii]ERT06205.1 AAA domain protein [Lyngbya aestuarii BL J]